MLDEFMQSPAYVMACQQYDRVADILDIGQSERIRTKMPKRAMIVSVPTRMDDGHTEMFTGYRVQHHLSVGPTKGGLRYPRRNAWRSRRVGDVDELEMFVVRFALWRCQGRRHV